jgi:hypothetical protein
VSDTSNQVTVRRASFSRGRFELLPQTPVDDAVSSFASVFLRKQEAEGSTNYHSVVGDVYPPYCVGKMKSLRLLNAHHSACLQNKISSSVSLGFQGDGEVEDDGKSKAEEILDPLSTRSRL